MTRLPNITVQGWTAEGPAYTIHRRIDGFRNRRLRREGRGAEELVGDHDAIVEDLEGPAAYMVLADGDVEVYAFKAGYVYQVTLLVDGDAQNILVDAREGDRIEKYGADLSLLEQRALEGEELEAALADGPAEASNVSDGAESQEPLEDTGVTALTGAQVEAPPVQPAPVAEQPAAEDDGEEPSTGEHDYDGTVAEFGELVEAMEDAELEDYAARDSRKGIREAAQRELDHRATTGSTEDDEDAVGGDGDPASDEEE